MERVVTVIRNDVDVLEKGIVNVIFHTAFDDNDESTPESNEPTGSAPAKKSKAKRKLKPLRKAAPKAPKAKAKAKKRKPTVRNGDAKFGRKVAAARAKKGWTQRELAVKLKYTQPAICNIEKGTVGPGPVFKTKVGKLLGVK